jgi:hypothetical protein
MDIKARIDELTVQQQALLARQQEDAVNTQRLAGAIAILTEQLAADAEELVAEPSKNGKVKEKIEA